MQFNTYDSPPNSELLRKYGHVDVFPLEPDVLKRFKPEDIGSWPYGNPGDEVEINGQEVVKAALTVRAEFTSGKMSENEAKERVEEWLNNGEEE